MAYFAQVGASAPSSNGDDDRGGSAFDPFSSHKYSRSAAQEPVAPVAEMPVAETPYPNFGLNPTQGMNQQSGMGQPQSGANSGASQHAGASQHYGAGQPVRVAGFSGQYGAAAGTQAGYGPAASYPEAGYDYVGDYGDGYATDEDELYAPAAAPRGELGRMAAMFGAVASVALVLSIGVWGYKLIVRDVSGVPVVSAVAGPMRIAPEEPGGEMADHIGLAVNAVAAHGIAADPADTLRLAPQVIALTEDDQPIPALTEAAEAEAALEAEFAADLSDTQGLTVAAAPVQEVLSPIEQRSNDIDALVASLTEGAVPLEDLRETSATIIQTEPIQAAVAAAVVPAAIRNAPGVRATLRPKVRPARFAPAASPAATPVRAQTETVELAPDSLAAGTRLAQLGAYESAEVARTEWTRISARFGEFFNDKQRVIQRAESGGRIFYRLRAHGFEDLSDARRFCSALVAGNADCIPVTMR